MDAPLTATFASFASTSTSLLVRLRAHDGDAWRRLAALYGPLVYRWARQAGLQPDDAADIAQEVFQAVARGLDGFRRDRPDDRFRGWLWTIARNKIRDHFRHRLGTAAAVGGTEAHQQLQQLPDRPEELEAASEGVAQLARRAIELLQTDFEPHTWQAFWKTAIEGRDTREVADELAMTCQSVRQARYRVLRRLRSELDP